MIAYLIFHSAKRLGSLKAKNGQTEEIAMGTNDAYETVDVHYEDGGKGRQAREQDEAIYDVPAV